MTAPYRPVATDIDGNRLWWASSEGDDLCPVCQHAPDLHRPLSGCQYALPDTYTHMTDVQLCECPLLTSPPDSDHSGTAS